MDQMIFWVMLLFIIDIFYKIIKCWGCDPMCFGLDCPDCSKSTSGQNKHCT